jgi:FkbM family methyltransferase
MFDRFLQPYFVWRPGQIVRAVRQKFAGPASGVATVRLPWGLDIRFPADDYIGHCLRMHGIMAVEACEAVFRLLDPGECGVDVGANVGIVSSAMVRRAGQSGRVVAFEMMPQTFGYLAENLAAWKRLCPDSAAVNCPVSDSESAVNIGLSSDFPLNSGVAYVTRGEVPAGTASLVATARTLDSYFPEPQAIHVLKLDVERHELPVLKGAARLLASGRVRDVVFEDALAPDSPAKEFLRSNAYSLFALRNGAFRTALAPLPATGGRPGADSDEYVDFLATRDPDRARSRWQRRGYLCLTA